MPLLGKRPLALLSEGRLSESQIRALTLLSLGWIEVFLAPEEEDDDRGRRRLNVVYNGNPRNYGLELLDRIKRDDDEVLGIIRTFIAWQESKVALTL